MKHFLLAILLALVVEQAALACSCIGPRNVEEVRELARQSSAGALALVEVEVTRGYSMSTGRGERMQVRRVVAGRSPRRFEVERLNFPSSASCDIELRRGQRTTLILYAPRQPQRAGMPRHRISGLCTANLLDHDAFRAVMIDALDRR